MNPKIIKAIIIFVCLLMVVLQIAALADPTGYIKCKDSDFTKPWDRRYPSARIFSSCVFKRGGGFFYRLSDEITVTPGLKCGMFQCDGFGNLREYMLETVLKEGKTYIKAACAFGVIAAVLMGISLVLHILLLPPTTLDKLMTNKVMAQVVKRFWIVHVLTAIFCTISWGLLLAYYVEFVKGAYDLQHGFAFLVINTCFELALVFVCCKDLHSASPKAVENEAVPSQCPDHQSANPIEGEA